MFCGFFIIPRTHEMIALNKQSNISVTVIDFLCWADLVSYSTFFEHTTLSGFMKKSARCDRMLTLLLLFYFVHYTVIFYIEMSCSF